jgi:hypothetical protein
MNILCTSKKQKFEFFKMFRKKINFIHFIYDKISVKKLKNDTLY